MTFEEFKNSLGENSPPENINPLLISLWYDAQGNWEKSHDLVSEDNSKKAASIHAYLHRKEGDLSNADYWYTRAGEKRKSTSFENEWESLVKSLIAAEI